MSLSLRAVLAAVCLALVVVPLQAAPPASRATAVLDSPAKGETDQRAYRNLQLANGMKVLLVSDPKADKASAALDVAVGSSSDPRHRQGLAHFLEHMLFLGTAKYPKPDEYQSFISAHGGSHNAFTSLEHTNYFFDIDPQHLAPALDRFAQFFIAPLFNGQYVEREKNAVHSEYQARIRDDERRLWDVFRELFHSGNPAATFSVGNLTTLSDSDNSKVRDDLVNFYERHYSANTMTLVVLGREPLPELQALVEPLFSAVPDRQLQLDNSARPIFRDGLLPARLSMQSNRDERHLQLVFPLPSMQPHYRTKPDAYLAYLLGHEGEGSLFHLLKERGWAETLSAGTGLSNSFGATFNVDITLTAEGYNHVDEVATLFFQAVAMLKDQGVAAWQYEEQKILSELAFRFQEQQDPMEYTSQLANDLQHYPPADAIRGDYLMEQLDEKLVRDLLDRLSPANVLAVVSAPDIRGDRTSQFYNTSYRVEPVTADTLALWQRAELFSGIHMPERNPFIPDKLKLKPSPLLVAGSRTAQVPQKISANPNYNLWFLQDTQFQVPKGSIMVYARSRHASATVREAAMSELFVRLLNDHLNSLLYTARLAGLDFVISKRSRGIAFQLTGYSDKQGLLLKSVMDTFRNPVFDEARFRLVKQQWQDELRNIGQYPPYQVLMQDVPVVLAHGYWGRDAYLQVLDTVTLKQVQDYVLEFSGAIVADVLVYGNFYQAEAVKLGKIVENTLELDAPRQADIPARIVELPPVPDPFLFIDPLQHDDAAVVKYFQAADDSVQQQVRMAMLAQVLKAPFFHALRTEQQLGYIVSAGYLPLARVPGLMFLVQSPTHGIGQIHQRADMFINEHFRFISSQDEQWFAQQRQALLTQLQEKPKNLSDQSVEFWNDMTLDYTGFDHREQQVAALQAMTRQDLLDTYRKTLLDKNRRQLLLVNPGKAGMKDLLDGSARQYILVDDTDKLKAQMSSHSLL